MITMKINIQNYFNDTDYSNVIEKVLTKASNLLNMQNKKINIILIDNIRMEEMNSLYREKDYPTDVLTFPDGYLNNLGDVFISIPKCVEQSKDLDHSFNRELGFLCAHGFLHTIGYDHQNEEEEKEMVLMQDKILNAAKLFR